jgi:hypothetical protein
MDQIVQAGGQGHILLRIESLQIEKGDLMYHMQQLLRLYTNYDTTILLPQEYNRGLVHLNLFEPPSSVISNRDHPRGSHRIRSFWIHCYWSRRIANSTLR